MACTSRKTVNGEPYEPRRVVVVIGDGHDTASKKSLKEVIEIAQRNLVTIYAMSTRGVRFPHRRRGQSDAVDRRNRREGRDAAEQRI